jgi:hypothetical protein
MFHANSVIDAVAQDILRAEPSARSKVAQCQPSNPSEIIARGKAALLRLEQDHWSHWRDVILALSELRSQALREAGSNKPQGPAYRAAISRRLRLHGFDRIHKSDRCRLLECADNLAAIDTWRASQTLELQLGLNHPRVVLAHWKRSLRPVRANTAKPIAPNLAAAWKSTSPDRRREFLDSLGRDGLCAAMSPKLIGEFAEHVVGLQGSLAGDGARSLATSLTAALRHTLSTTIESEAVAGLAAIKRKLAGSGRTLHDIVIALGIKEKKPRRAA